MPRLLAELEAVEAEINAQIPLGIVDFSVERDVLSGELMIAGVFCEDTRPPAGPTWQEILVLKRLPWKPRAALAAALGHEWIRDAAVPANQARLAEQNRAGVFKITVDPRIIPVRPELQRSGCGRGFIMPPDNEWYVFQYRDVVAISNSKPIIDGVQRLSISSGDPELGIGARDSFDISGREPGTVTAWADLEPLHRYLNRAREEYGAAAKLVTRFVNIGTLRRMQAKVDLNNPEMLSASIDVQMRTEGLRRFPYLDEVYSLAPESMAEGISHFVPADSTFFAATLRMQPEHFFDGLVQDYLSANEREQINSRLRSMGEYTELDQFLGELAERLGNTSYIAVGRLDETFDEIEYDDWFAGEHDPFAGFAFMTRIREGTSLDEINEFLSKRVPLLGFSKEFERKEHMGIPYTRISLDIETRDFALLSPCWLLAQDHFVFSTNEDYFKKVIETIVEPSKSLANDNNFRVTMNRLSDKGHLGVFLDLDKLLAVPETSEPGGQPRGYAWDNRNQWVLQYRDSRQPAIDKRQELVNEFKRRNRGRMPNDDEWDKIEMQVDDFVDAWQAGYPDYIEEFRRELEAYRRFRALGLVMGAGGASLSAEAVLLLDEAARPAADGTAEGE